jgi:hypothetical protein
MSTVTKRVATGITLGGVIVVLSWLLLGGVVIRTSEELVGGASVVVGRGKLDAWLQANFPPERLLLLGITRTEVGAPYRLALSSIVDDSGNGKLIVRSVTVVDAGGDSRDVLESEQIVVPYERDTHRAPRLWAYHNSTVLPLTYDAANGAEIIVTCDVVFEGMPPVECSLRFVVRRAARERRVIPYWQAVYELGQSA